jgi:uncharacterized protein (DUF362 family)
MWNRRQFVLTSLAASVASLLPGCEQQQIVDPQRWENTAYRKPKQSRVAILSAKDYTSSLKEIILTGLKLFPLEVKGKTIVLKPNLVEYDPRGVVNTHPAIIAAAIDAFRTLDAREIIVAEGPGHRRDNEYLLTASGLFEVLKEYRATYVDLDNDDARPVKVKSHYTGFPHLYLPETILKADLLVSMPKLKTHHWAGATLSMKNLFGIIPSAIYGWPKNPLHWAGIGNSIIDINSALSIPQFAIVDGIVGMEGNGPIQGQAKHCGVLLFGDDYVAVDATAARLMMLEPYKIEYLFYAGQFLGNIARERIEQIGERVEAYQKDFIVMPFFEDLKTFI